MNHTNLQPARPRRWNPRSIAILLFAWAILQLGGLFTPGLLDDVDSIYIEIAREMLHRHDYVTPYINGIRFFDKPPLMYWMAAGSMSVFGENDWAARLPLALAVLLLLLSVYALGIRLFRATSPTANPDRAGLYAALALATGIGPYLYTRFYIPDILLCLWLTLGIHLFLIALDRINARINARASNTPPSAQISPNSYQALSFLSPLRLTSGTLLPCLAFAAILALNVLTKGLIGLVFPLAFVFLYLALTKQLQLLKHLHLLASTAVFAAIVAPWHILAALRNPAIPLPQGIGLPATGGWAWFYLYNEHIARFLQKRIPHDYGQTPVWLFWLFTFLWIMPWAAFLPPAIASAISVLRKSRVPHLRGGLIAAKVGPRASDPHSFTDYGSQPALTLLLWAGIVLGFFTLSARQEYYNLPALPALALLAGGLLAQADTSPTNPARRQALRASLYLLVPIGTLTAAICLFFAIKAPHLIPDAEGHLPDLATLLASNPDLYNLSLGHLFDLTPAAMGLFRGPLAATSLGMAIIGPIAYLIRRRQHTYAANLTLATGMVVILLAAHEGLVRFNPILGSKDLATSILTAQAQSPHPDDLIILDGELTSGSTLVFYTRQQLHLVNGRVNGLWYGSFWPDAPDLFDSEAGLRALWASPRRIFLFTSNPTARTTDLTPYAPVHTLAAAGGKSVLTNH